MILLTPGPTMTTETVRQAAAAHDVNHRESAFAEIVADIKTRLRSSYDGMSEWTPYLLGGSGTAAVEAMITSCIVDGPALIIDNGHYSGRIAEILAIHRIPHEVLSFDWETPIDVAQVIDAMDRTKFEAVLLTQHETTLGLLNPVSEISAEARRRGARVLVDAMSGFGADPLEVSQLDAVAASANKCLHGLPGVSFVLASPTLVGRMAPDRTYYLSLPRYAADVPPLTPPVPCLMAFRQALHEFESAKVREAEYLAKKTLVLDRLRALRHPWFDAGPTSSTIVSIAMPSGWTFDRLFAHFEHLGYVIYGCKGHLRDSWFQISWMGAITHDQLEAWLDEFERILKS